jgi:NodT family efflux transporter outer membrane factor (OMF) lipoprotein
MIIMQYRKNAIASLIGAVLLSTGCSMVGPDYIKPEAAVEKNWVSSPATAINNDSSKLALWWQVFNDPVLNNLIDQARKDNLSLQAAGVRIAEARAQLGITTGSLYPQVQQAGAGVTQQKISGYSPNTTPLVDRSFATNSIGFDVGWEIDVWGKFRRGIQASEANLDASIASYEDVLVSITAEVARVYVLFRTNESLIQVANDNVKIQKRTLEIARTLYNGGVINEMDYLQADTLLHNTLATIPPLEARLQQAKNALNVLLGKPAGSIDTLLATKKPVPVAPLKAAIGVPAEMLRRRPDIRLAERQLATQSSLIGVAKAELYPHFSLIGSIGLSASDAAMTYASMGGNTLGQIFNAKSFQYSIGPSVSWNIFNYGRITNQVRVEDARFQALISVYQQTVLNAAKEAEDALAGFVNAQKNFKELQISYDAARRSTDLSLYQYQEGLIDYLRVLDSQRSLITVQDALTRSYSDISLNLIILYKAVGGGWQTDNAQNFISEKIKKQMRDRTNWGDIMKPDALDLPKKEKTRLLRSPDW